MAGVSRVPSWRRRPSEHLTLRAASFTILRQAEEVTDPTTSPEADTLTPWVPGSETLTGIAGMFAVEGTLESTLNLFASQSSQGGEVSISRFVLKVSGAPDCFYILLLNLLTYFPYIRFFLHDLSFTYRAAIGMLFDRSS